MIAALTLAALVSYQPAPQASIFAPKFTKDEVTSYAAKVSGAEGGNDVMFDVQFDLTTKGDTKDGKTPVSIKFTRMLASFGGEEQTMEEADVELTLDKSGAPTEMNMQGPVAVAYVALVTQYLPGKALNVGETYKAELNLGGAKITLDGSYSGEEELEGKKYHVLKSKLTLTPTDQEPGTVSTNSFFDAALGKVVKTESSIETPDGTFKLVVSATPKKK